MHKVTVTKHTMTTETLTDSELIDCHANALATYNLAGGHSKAARNKNLMEQYASEIERRGLRVSLKPGIFNGPGSY